MGWGDPGTGDELRLLQIFIWEESHINGSDGKQKWYERSQGRKNPMNRATDFHLESKLRLKTIKIMKDERKILSVEFQSKFWNIGSVGRRMSWGKSLHLSVPGLHPICETGVPTGPTPQGPLEDRMGSQCTCRSTDSAKETTGLSPSAPECDSAYFQRACLLPRCV